MQKKNNLKSYKERKAQCLATKILPQGCIRSSDGKRTASRSLCAVKPHSAESVLARGTSMERSVMNTFFFFFSSSTAEKLQPLWQGEKLQPLLKKQPPGTRESGSRCSAGRSSLMSCLGSSSSLLLWVFSTPLHSTLQKKWFLWRRPASSEEKKFISCSHALMLSNFVLALVSPRAEGVSIHVSIFLYNLTCQTQGKSQNKEGGENGEGERKILFLAFMLPNFVHALVTPRVEDVSIYVPIFLYNLTCQALGKSQNKEGEKGGEEERKYLFLALMLPNFVLALVSPRAEGVSIHVSIFLYDPTCQPARHSGLIRAKKGKKVVKKKIFFISCSQALKLCACTHLIKGSQLVYICAHVQSQPHTPGKDLSEKKRKEKKNKKVWWIGLTAFPWVPRAEIWKLITYGIYEFKFFNSVQYDSPRGSNELFEGLPKVGLDLEKNIFFFTFFKLPIEIFHKGLRLYMKGMKIEKIWIDQLRHFLMRRCTNGVSIQLGTA